MSLMSKRLALVPAVALMLALGSAPAFAAANPSGMGPPSQSCEEQPAGPPGFQTSGFQHAQTVYNEKSQYDVACYQLSHKGG